MLNIKSLFSPLSQEDFHHPNCAIPREALHSGSDRTQKEDHAFSRLISTHR